MPGVDLILENVALGWGCSVGQRGPHDSSPGARVFPFGRIRFPLLGAVRRFPLASTASAPLRLEDGYIAHRTKETGIRPILPLWQWQKLWGLL